MDTKKPDRAFVGPAPFRIAVVLLLLLAGALSVHWTMGRTESDLRATFLAEARMAAYALDAAQLAALTGSAADLENPVYLELKTRLQRMRAAHPHGHAVYLLGWRAEAGAAYYLADSEPPDSEHHKPPGSPFEPANSGAASLWDPRAEQVLGPAMGRRGTCVSARVPVLDPETGALVAMLGLDCDARKWRRSVLASAAWPLAQIVSVLGLATLCLLLLRSRAKGSQQLQNLREIEGNFKALYESMNDIVAVATLDGRILHANGAACRRLGYRESELVGMNLLDWHPPDRRDEARRIMAEMIAGKRSSCSIPLITKEGTLLNVDTHAWMGRWGEAECLFGISKAMDPAEEAKKFLESTFQHNPSPMALSTAVERRFVEVNDAFLRVTGYTREEVIGRTTVELRLFVDEHDRRAVLERLTTDGRISGVQMRIRRKDGSIRVGLFSGEVLQSRGRAYFLTVMLDVTELRHAEVQVAFQAQVLDHVSASVVVTDLEGEILYWGRGAEQLYGFTAAETLHKPYRQFGGSVDPVDEQAFRRELLASGAWQGEHLQRRRDGSTFWSAVHISLLKDAEGRPVGFIGVDHDVSERKQAEEELRHRESLLDAAARIGRVLLTAKEPGTVMQEVIDIIGEASGQDRSYFFACEHGTPPLEGVVSMRQEWVKAGVSAQMGNAGLQNIPMARVVPSVHERLVRGLPYSCVVAEMPVEERAIVESQGIISLLLMPVMADGIYQGFIGFDDCEEAYRWTSGECSALAIVAAAIGDALARWRAEADRERLQAQLLHAHKLESVGRLAGGVAHDFNNMLGIILGHAEIALRQVAKDQPIHADLREIHVAAERSAALTRQLLAFARKQTAMPRAINLNETVEDMLSMLRRLIGEEITLAWKPGEVPWPVFMDPTQLDQVLANLCVNGRDAIAGRGHLVVETGTALLDAAFCAGHAEAAPGEYVRLSVTDDGCGMDEETLAHIFEPFFTTKALGQGTGLGLAMVYGVIKQNHGLVEIRSQPGVGTTFNLYLPRHQGASADDSAEASAVAPAPGGPAGVTILLVEDEAVLLMLTRRMLETQGYRVLSAATPGEAIRLAESAVEPITLLMTDVVMPEMNGRELATQLQRRFPGLKLLYMSGYTADVIATHGVLEDGIDFIQKPFSFAKLAACLRQLLGDGST